MDHRTQALQSSGIRPMSLADRKCPGGITRTHPPRLRADCSNCKRLRPFGEEVEETDVDPVGAWHDAEHGKPGYCRERIALLSAEQMRGVDEMLDHGTTVHAVSNSHQSIGLGGSAGTTFEQEQS